MLPQALLEKSAYPHPVASLELIETHLSWVFLTGEYAYKVKKPVRFDFVDFSTLALRRHFCFAELSCNRRFAPELYVDVVALTEDAGGGLQVLQELPEDESGIVEYAVRMRQFDGSQQADRLLAEDRLSLDELRQFGTRLAEQHAQLPVLDLPYDPDAAIIGNFETLKDTPAGKMAAAQLDSLAQTAHTQLKMFQALLRSRHRQQYVRECHGDLHLSNLARLPLGLTAFDCLEFDVDLRNIDFWCDSAFLFMDCCVRKREDLAYAFVDGYLDVSGDYEGVCLLNLFADYRSVVRAKIAALRHQQTAAEEDLARMQRHLDWPQQRARRPTGRLWVTCGLSGSGKSFWAQRLLPELPAIRLRSDVLRKRQHGLASLADSESAVASGLYQPDHSQQVYAGLAEHATQLLDQGEDVIVDAACLHAEQRRLLYASAAAAGAEVRLLHFTASEDVLRERISSRQRDGGDPSEADHAVLDWQLEHFEIPGGDEPLVTVDTQALELSDLLALLA